jgi:hypothetical protein
MITNLAFPKTVVIQNKKLCGDYPVRVILSPVVMLPAVALPAVVALPRCCTAETGVTVARPTTPTTPNAATIAIARTNIFEFIDHELRNMLYKSLVHYKEV